MPSASAALTVVLLRSVRTPARSPAFTASIEIGAGSGSAQADGRGEERNDRAEG